MGIKYVSSAREKFIRMLIVSMVSGSTSPPNKVEQVYTIKILKN